MSKSDIKIEFMRGKGPGGQHKNKTDSACRATHIPTGISAYADERSQRHSKKLALAELNRRLQEEVDNDKAARKKERRDKAIHDTRIIRTYDFKSGVVKDHRTKKKASIKDVLRKGRFDLLHPDEF